MSFYECQWSKDEHTLFLTGEAERAVRAFIYDLIGRKGEFVLYFENMKFSDPICLVHGDGFVRYKDSMIHFVVEKDRTVLSSNDQKKLVSIVTDALDKLM